MGQDKSSAAGIFVLTVEHVHGGGDVLAFGLGSKGKEPEGDDSGGKGGPGTPGWLPSLA